MRHDANTISQGSSQVQETIREICSAGAGVELADMLRIAFEAGAPVWHGVEGVVVPRLAVLEVSDGLDWVLVEALSTGSQPMFDRAWKNLTARKQFKRLAAAVYCDLLGLTEAEAAALLGFAVDTERRARGLETTLKQGRVAWAQLGAWPWWCWQPPDGKFPTGWSQEDSVQQMLIKWCARLLPFPLPTTAASLASPLPQLAPSA